jgi:HKD family nuclease
LNSELRFLEAGQILSRIKLLTKEYDDIDIAISYVKEDGWKLLEPAIKRAISHGKRIRMVVCSSQVTDSKALLRILRISNKSQGLFEARYINDSSFHAKIMVFKKAESRYLLLGSSNLTRAGLLTNWEANLALEGERTNLAISAASNLFDRLWKRESAKLDKKIILEVKEGENRLRKQLRDFPLLERIKLPSLERTGDLHYILGCLLSRGSVCGSAYKTTFLFRVPARQSATKRRLFLSQTFLPLLRQTLQGTIKVSPISYSNGYFTLSIKNAQLKKMLDEYGVHQKQFDLHGRVPKPLLNGDRFLLRNFVSGVTDFIGGVESAFRSGGKKRISLNLMEANPQFLVDMVHAFGKCHVHIFDVNVSKAFSKNLKGLDVKISTGSHTPHIRIWLDDYLNNFDTRRQDIRQWLV